MNDNAPKLAESVLPATATFADGTLVRSTNALYTCYGVGRIQKVRGEQAKVECDTMTGKRR